MKIAPGPIGRLSGRPKRKNRGTDCVFPSATTAKDRLKATGYVTSAFEIIDARIQRIEHPNFAGAGA